MSKTRMISTDLWSDTWIDWLDPIEKLLYIYCFTNDKSSWCWATEIPIKKIWYETGVDRDMVSKILKRFEDDGKVIYYNWYLLVKNFIKRHFSGVDSPDKRSKNNQLKAIEEEVRRLSDDLYCKCYGFITWFSDICNQKDKGLVRGLQGACKGIVPLPSPSPSSLPLSSKYNNITKEEKSSMSSSDDDDSSKIPDSKNTETTDIPSDWVDVANELKLEPPIAPLATVARKRNIINKSNKEQAKSIYNLITKHAGIVDWDYSDCAYLYYKLVKTYPTDWLEILESVITRIKETDLKKYYSIASPNKLCANLGSIVQKIGAMWIMLAINPIDKAIMSLPEKERIKIEKRHLKKPYISVDEVNEAYQKILDNEKLEKERLERYSKPSS